jgi:hypothetical protein
MPLPPSNSPSLRGHMSRDTLLSWPRFLPYSALSVCAVSIIIGVVARDLDKFTVNPS